MRGSILSEMSIDGTLRVCDREVIEEASWRISCLVEHKLSARI